MTDLSELDLGSKRLRPYQCNLIEKVRDEIRKGRRRIIINSPTGSGKTTLTCGIIKLSANRGSLSMFMAPRRELLRQTAEHLIDCDIKYSFIAAGLGEQMAGSECLVVSKDTLHHRAVRRSKIPIPKTNVLAVDECHLSAAPRFMALMLEIEKQNPGMVTLGLSATPGRADGLGDFWESIVTAAGYEELRELGFLVPARVFLGHAPDMKGVRSIEWESEAAKRVDKPKLVGDIVENWIRLASDRKTFVFGATQSHATHLRDEFLKAGIRAAHVDDTTPSDERAQAFDDLKSGAAQQRNCVLHPESTFQKFLALSLHPRAAPWSCIDKGADVHYDHLKESRIA